MSIESFAAAVSDNDGAAFITKAEFDSLKNEFQTQINQYNTSIDNKINGAISSYLAGAKEDKVSKLRNLYANITAQKKIYWVSGQYQRTANKPYPKYQWSFDQAFNTTAFSISATWPGANLYLYEGTEKSGKYYVDYLMTLDARLESYHSYLLADQTFNKVPNGSYNPTAVSILSRITLQTPSTDRSNWRGIFVSYFYKEDKTEGRNLMFTPWSTAKTYAHISNNRNSISLGTDALFNYYPYDSSKTGYVTPTLTDTRNDKSKQTINPLTATKYTGGSIQVVKNDKMVFPWLQKQWVMNEIYYNIIVNATGEDLPIKYGVKICETTDSGTLEIKMKSDYHGYGIFHIGDPICNWPKTQNLVDNTNRIYSTKNLAANEEGTITFRCNANEKVWFVFCSTNESAGCQVEFTSIKQTRTA